MAGDDYYNTPQSKEGDIRIRLDNLKVCFRENHPETMLCFSWSECLGPGKKRRMVGPWMNCLHCMFVKFLVKRRVRKTHENKAWVDKKQETDPEKEKITRRRGEGYLRYTNVLLISELNTKNFHVKVCYTKPISTPYQCIQ